MKVNKTQKSPKFLQAGGEMGRLIREKDWSSTSLGSPENWPVSLKFAIGSMLRTAFPKFIWWGESLLCFYNDAYRPSLGKEGKHPIILGQKGERAWPEIWGTIKPLIDQVWNTGKPIWMEDQLIPIYRNGKMEDVYWTFSYSALLGDDENVGGVLVTCTETTKAVLNLKKLEESENQLAFAINAAELSTWDYNPITNKFSGNQRLKSWFGIPRKSEMDLQIALKAIIPSDQARVTKEINAALNGANDGKYDITYSIQNKKNKEIKIVHALGRAWFGENNKAIRFNGILQDVTQKVEAEKELQDAYEKIRNEEKQFRNIVQNAPVGIAIFKGSTYRVEMANNSVLRALDKHADKFLGQNIFKVLPEMKPDIAPLFKEVEQKQKSVRGTEFKVSIKRKGKIQNSYFDFILYPINLENEETQEIMLVANEVTDYIVARNILKEHENQFRNLVLQSPIAMAILRGKDLKIEMANEKMLNHFWRRTFTEVIGKRIIDVFPELKDQQYPAELGSVIATGNPIRNKESKAVVAKNGENIEFYINYNYLPLKELDDKVTGVMITVTDVTDQVLAKEKLLNFSRELEKQVNERTGLLQSSNERLEQSIKKLENANDELESFAYVSSHDLQEPLRKIQMFTSRILEQEQLNLSETTKKYFDKITLSASRMRTLIDDLLSFSRTYKEGAKLEPTDLNLIVEQVLENLSVIIENKNSKVTRSRLPIIAAVPFQLTQVFSNLIGNALKFSYPDRPPRININWGQVDGNTLNDYGLTEASYHKITVRDNGIGIAAGMEDKIFEVFQRLHGKHEYEGTGIGLSIVKKIIVNHKGFITAKNNSGEGSTFTIYLPIPYVKKP
ncbi:PAS domain-containing protein [Flavobacteriaceae bacterium F89]|uniref:histidine kinase n=1 Tax=Cerina litoralis TaxID=2874477 RepID=A0AAE3ESB6_9FLAO|nr:ATP-binding protein [Cerina litoralis]MCG2460317.1 PAS domain-containing protein [Cerina litoralis]